MCRNLANDIMLRTWKIMDQGSRIQDLLVVSENALDFKNESLQRLLRGLWNRSRRVLGKTLLDEKTTNEKNEKRSEKEDEKGKSKTPWRPTWIFAEMLSNFACLIGKAIYLTCHACKKSWNYAWKKSEAGFVRAGNALLHLRRDAERRGGRRGLRGVPPPRRCH